MALYSVLLVLVFALGATIGSFLNVVIYRLPREMDFVSGRSYCTSCHRALKPRDLVPIVSYLALRGKCRFCKGPISPRYMIVEALTGVLALSSYLAFLPPGGFLLAAEAEGTDLLTGSALEAGLAAEWLPFGLSAATGAVIAAAMVFLLLCLLLLVTCIDAETMEIPNALSAWIAVLGLISTAVGPTAALPWYDHLIGAVCVSLPMLMLAFIISGAFGLGDVKLMAAAGLFLGWRLAVLAALLGILFGGIYGIYLLLTRKKGRKEHFAFGPALCAGIALGLFVGEPLIGWYLGFF